METRRMLVSLAHPDDESFGWGGLIARYVSEGVEVYYICATRGNRGTVADNFIDKFGSIDAVRDAELECAAEVLGFKEVIKLGYGDSGMMGSPENDDPECLWQADEDVVTGQVVEVIRRVKPQVVLTFDSYGGYGHPDHIFMHRATTRAFHAAGDPGQFPDKGEPYSPQKLYNGAFSRRILQFWMLQMRLRGQDPRRAGANQDMDFTKVLENAQATTTSVDISKFLDTWDQASQCHASQISPRTGMGRFLRWLLSRKQGLARKVPEPRPGEKTERDIFAGVEL